MSAKEKMVQMAQQIEAPGRVPLSRGRVLRATVALADEAGIESLSMRKLATANERSTKWGDPRPGL